MGSGSILVVGAADTGRAPMTAALLRRMLANEGRDWAVASAGVVGHDDDPAEPEARSAMVSLGLDISFHQARSLSDELVAEANLLLVDSGTALVIASRYPALTTPVISLGQLAGSRRDIPDPFRMQVGAWISYAREIEAMLRRGLGRLIEMVEGAHSIGTQQAPSAISSASPPSAAMPAPIPFPAAAIPAPVPLPHSLPAVSEPALADSAPAREITLARCQRLLGLISDFPGVVEWSNAQGQLRSDLLSMSTSPLQSGDMVQPYCAMLIALLDAATSVPSGPQVQLLQQALARLQGPVAAAEMSALMGEVGKWGGSDE
jgi:protein-tyrosine phosphatase